MRILKSLAILAITTLAVSCEQGGTSIEAEVSGTDEVTLVAVNGNKTDTVGSIDASGGSFTQQLEIDTAQLYFLFADENLTIPIFVKPGEQVQLNISAGQPDGDYTVSGSEESERIKKITNVVDSAMARIDSLNKVSQEMQNDPNFMQIRMQLQAKFEDILKNAASEYRQMIDEKPGSIANVFIFSQGIGNTPILSVQEDFEYYQKVADGLQENYPELEITKNLQNRMGALRKEKQRADELAKANEAIKPGSPAPEISLPNPEGETMQLSDLEGNVVLVDFWASWCRPCRVENPNLVRIYNEYKDEGFRVFSVSLDGMPQQQNPKDQWVQAIEQDNLTWDYHVSDLKGWSSSVVPKFGFQGIPYTVLVDRDGNIIETNLRGPQLEAKLKEVFGRS